MGWKVGRLGIGQWLFSVEEEMLSEMMMLVMVAMMMVTVAMVEIIMMMMVMTSAMIMLPIAGTWQFQLLIWSRFQLSSPSSRRLASLRSLPDYYYYYYCYYHDHHDHYHSEGVVDGVPASPFCGKNPTGRLGSCPCWWQWGGCLLVLILFCGIIAN